MALFFASSLFLNVPKAQAAYSDENFNLVREVASEIGPALSPIIIDDGSSTLALAPDGYLNKPLVIETQVTSVNSLPIKKTVKSSAVKTSSGFNVKLDTSGNNHFAYGWCTYYVASRRNIPWFGNAGTWLSGARGAGFATGSTPQVGAIIVTAESRYGHVGIVESVNSDGTITISEMNYSGWNRVSSRTISTSYGAIKGYIY